MKTKDVALTISNPRLLAAVYFSLLAIIATIAMDTLLYALGVKELLPIFKAILLAVVVSACFGALFGKRIVLSDEPHRRKAFFWAFLMVIVSLPIYNLGFLYLFKERHAELFIHASFPQIVHFYLFVLFYGFILFGFWLAIIAGLAALYLRGYLVYYLLDSLNLQRKKPEKTLTKLETHADNNE